MTEPIFDEKLTKRFFMGLPAGVYLVSGVGGFTPFERDFEAEVSSQETRQAQWQQIKQARVDRCTCMVFESKHAYDEWNKGWKQCTDRIGWYRDGP